MKKVLALITALVLAISLCACGKKDIRGKISGENGGDEVEFSLGVVDGLTYENAFIGLGCTLDSDWSFYSDEQIRELNNVLTDIAGDEYVEMMKNADIVYDMYATDSSGTNILNVNLEKVNFLQLAVLDVGEALEGQVPALVDTLVNIGYHNVNCVRTTVIVGDEEYDAIKASSEFGDAKMYETIFAKKCSGYLANITVATYQDDTTEELIGKFYNID